MNISSIARTRGVCPAALRLCAADAGVPLTDIRAVACKRNFKSTVVFLAAGSAAPGPTHVVKLERGPVSWNPQWEFEGLTFVAGGGPPGVGLGRIVPVGFGRSPAFLLTRYQPGLSVGHVFDDVIRGSAGAGNGAAGGDCAAAMARWLAWLRTREPARSTGLTGADLMMACEHSARGLSSVVNGDVLRATLARIGRFLEQLPAGDRPLLGRTFPSHGDLHPQNFLVDGDEVLYAIDLECFAWRPLDFDVARFRFALELYVAWRRSARMAAEQLWRAFMDAYVDSGASARLSLLSCLERLLEQLACAGRPRPGLRGLTPVGLLRRVRDRRWIGDRVRWLTELEDDLDGACERFCTRL